jgi:hypothetical protein
MLIVASYKQPFLQSALWQESWGGFIDITERLFVAGQEMLQYKCT